MKMPEALDILVAGRPVRIEVDSPSIRAELKQRTAGFGTSIVSREWLRLVTCTVARRIGGDRLRVSPAPGDNYVLKGCTVEGRFITTTEPPTAELRVVDARSVCQGLFACASLLLPWEGGLLIHADAVVRDGIAIAVAGHSGVGKSTSATTFRRDERVSSLAIDRTVVLGASAGELSRVSALPRLQRDEENWGPPREVRLGAVLFPQKGEGVSIRELQPSVAAGKVVSAALLPNGTGQPWARVLSLASDLAAKVPMAEVYFEPDADLSGAVAAAGYW